MLSCESVCVVEVFLFSFATVSRGHENKIDRKIWTEEEVEGKRISESDNERQ